MASLTALLPVAQGMAAYAALCRAADSANSDGSAAMRGRGQLMADTLVERLTGQATAHCVPMKICVLTTGETLAGQGCDPGMIPGYGPIPA